MDAEATTLVTTVIWTLRICLPIILFLLYYRVPFPDFLPKKNRHSRQKLLALRPLKGTPPVEMSNLGLVDQATAPHLFVKQKRGKGEAKGGHAAGIAESTEDPLADGKLPPQDMLHLESLLNYMAFNRKSHRIFHPLKPPPPPSAPPPPNCAAPSADFQQKANLDAQMVLAGALMFKKLEVVTDVYDSLTNTKVTPSEQTFTLMVEVCLVAHDLPKASDFLMKMEECQYSPDVKLLDRVMELYAQHKVTTELGQRLSAEKDAGMTNGASILSADAPEFRPSPASDDVMDGWNPNWTNGTSYDWEWRGDRKAKGGKAKGNGKENGKGKEDGKGKGKWTEKGSGWNKWESAEWKANSKGEKGKGKTDSKKGEKGKGKSSDMPEKPKKPGPVWRKKEGSDAPQEA